jgi:hypothetical protein
MHEISVVVGKYPSKKARLRMWRQMAYHVLIVALVVSAVGHYYGTDTQAVCIASIFLGDLLSAITKKLAMKF